MKRGGIVNKGSTCFLGSAAQCLSACAPLRLALARAIAAPHEGPDPRPRCTATALSRLAADVVTATGAPADPAPLLAALPAALALSDGAQHDAHEALSALIDAAHEDLNAAPRPPAQLPQQGAAEPESAEAAWRRHTARNDSPVAALFHGLLESRVQCGSCAACSRAWDPMATACLPLGRGCGNRSSNVLCVPAGPEDAPVRRPRAAALVHARAASAVLVELRPGAPARLWDAQAAAAAQPTGELLALEAPCPPRGAPSASWCLALVEQYTRAPAPGRGGGVRAALTRLEAVGFPVLVWARRRGQVGTEGGEGPEQERRDERERCEEELAEAVWRRLRWFLVDERRALPHTQLAALTTRPVEVEVGAEPDVGSLLRVSAVWDWAAYRKLFDREHTRRIGAAPKEDMDEEEEEARGLALEDCLRAFTEAEELPEASWRCPRCGVPRDATKRLLFSRLPPVLVLQLQRFDQRSDPAFARKCSDSVRFPLLGLDMSPFCCGEGGGTGAARHEALYDLFAVCNHHGAASFGHYTAFVRREEDGAWLFCDDEDVREVRDPASVVTPAAYVLLYQRRGLALEAHDAEGSAERREQRSVGR